MLVFILFLCACAPEASEVAPQLNDTQWLLLESGEPIIAQTTLIFQDFQFRADAGCNEISGIYNVDGDQLILHNMTRTDVACLDADVTAYESEVVRWLGSAETFQQSADQLIINTPTQQLTFIPLRDAVSDHAFTVQVENAKDVDDLTVQLLNGTTKEVLAHFAIENGTANVSFNEITDGYYEIKLLAPDRYFRDPLAYGFQMRDGFPFDVPNLDLTFVLDETRIPCEPLGAMEPYPTVAPYPTEAPVETATSVDTQCEHELTRNISNVPTRSPLVAVGCSEGGMGVHSPEDLRCHLAKFGSQYVESLSDDLVILYAVENGFTDWSAGAFVYHIPSVSALHIGFCGDPDPHIGHFDSPAAATQFFDLLEDDAEMERIKQRVLAEWGDYIGCPRSSMFMRDSVQAVYFAGEVPTLELTGDVAKQVLIVNEMEGLREAVGGTVNVLWIDAAQIDAVDPTWLDSIAQQHIPIALIGESVPNELFCRLNRFPATIACPPEETEFVAGFTIWREWPQDGDVIMTTHRHFAEPPTVERLLITTLPLRPNR